MSGLPDPAKWSGEEYGLQFPDGTPLMLRGQLLGGSRDASLGLQWGSFPALHVVVAGGGYPAAACDRRILIDATVVVNAAEAPPSWPVPPPCLSRAIRRGGAGCPRAVGRRARAERVPTDLPAENPNREQWGRSAWGALALAAGGADLGGMPAEPIPGVTIAEVLYLDHVKSSNVTIMWQKIADGVYAIMDADGLPAGLATTLDDGTPLKVADQWWSASRKLVEWADSDAAREFLERCGESHGETES